MEILSNIKYISNVSQYVIDGNDGIINVDTSVNPVLIVLPNINNSGYANTNKGFIINDISNNAATNNITIVATNNSVNSTSSVVVSNDGGTAKCSVANLNEWFVVTEPQSGGSGNADNGLNVSSGIIKLGGALVEPTIVSADSTNFFTLEDENGSFIETRDSVNNFKIADYGGSTYSNSANIFSYLASTNSYVNTNIVVNFGSIKTFDNATDTWSFGDYGSYTNTSVTFDIGRSNQLGVTQNISIFGNSNVVAGSKNTTIIGSFNSLTNVDQFFVLGNANKNIYLDTLGNLGNRQVMNSVLHFEGLLEFTDNADALTNNLEIGDFYRTGDFLKVVH
jgi:hypothetical protein